jgi:hypothetical protein
MDFAVSPTIVYLYQEQVRILHAAGDSYVPANESLNIRVNEEQLKSKLLHFPSLLLVSVAWMIVAVILPAHTTLICDNFSPLVKTYEFAWLFYTHRRKQFHFIIMADITIVCLIYVVMFPKFSYLSSICASSHWFVYRIAAIQLLAWIFTCHMLKSDRSNSSFNRN